MKMESLRPYFWAILLLAIIASSLVIIIIFIIINVCIRKKKAASSYNTTQTKPNHYDNSIFQNQENKVFHKNVENEKPPLPPRDQFQSMDSVQSYEQVEPLPDYVKVEESAPLEAQQPFAPQYTTDEIKSQDGVRVCEFYDEADMPANDDSDDYDEAEIPANNDSDDYDEADIPANNDSDDYDDVDMPADDDSEDYDDIG